MLSNLKIKTVLTAALSFLIALMLAIGVLGVYVADHSVNLVRDVTLNDQKNVASKTAIRLEMETNRSQILQALQHNPTLSWSQLHDHALSVHFDLIEAVSARAAKRWAQYLDAIKSTEEKRLAQEWYAKSDGLGLEHIKTAAAAIRAEKWDDAEAVLIKKINPSYRVGDVAMKALTELSEANARADEASVNATLRLTAYTMVGVLVLAVILGVLVGWLLVRSISAPLGDAMAIATRVAEGDLTGHIEVSSNNEIGALLRALGKMKANLAGIVGEVRTSTDIISSASRQIAAGNMDLSERSYDQAGSLEKTASSMEELTSTVKQNADNARQANQLAMSASEVASKGGIVVAQVVATMGSINESSKKIVDIIGVIDGIAFQTNILALNAAVEAARAGEQGRGFAVVASEVRNLAQRSAGAAKEIKELIGDSVGKVDSGAKLVDQAGATMHEIVTSIQRVTDIMGEITQASAEQTSGLDQINQSIDQLDSITQQNVALVEEAAAAASSLQNQAGVLTEVVGVFKIALARQAGKASPAEPRTPLLRGAAPVRQLSAVRPAAKAPAAKPAARARSAAAANTSDWEEF